MSFFIMKTPIIAASLMALSHMAANSAQTDFVQYKAADGLRTSSFASYNTFGKDVLGEKWVSHWGKRKVEAGKGVIEPAHASHPILRGVTVGTYEPLMYGFNTFRKNVKPSSHSL